MKYLSIRKVKGVSTRNKVFSRRTLKGRMTLLPGCVYATEAYLVCLFRRWGWIIQTQPYFSVTSMNKGAK